MVAHLEIENVWHTATAGSAPNGGGGRGATRFISETAVVPREEYYGELQETVEERTEHDGRAEDDGCKGLARDTRSMVGAARQRRGVWIRDWLGCCCSFVPAVSAKDCSGFRITKTIELTTARKVPRRVWNAEMTRENPETVSRELEVLVGT